MSFRDLFGIALGGLLGGLADVIDRRYRRAERVFWSLVARVKGSA